MNSSTSCSVQQRRYLSVGVWKPKSRFLLASRLRSALGSSASKKLSADESRRQPLWAAELRRNSNCSLLRDFRNVKPIKRVSIHPSIHLGTLAERNLVSGGGSDWRGLKCAASKKFWLTTKMWVLRFLHGGSKNTPSILQNWICSLTFCVFMQALATNKGLARPRWT